jgi:lipopolysaccharide export system permease protein
MRILDRYIFRSVAAVFLLCLFTFIFLYIIIDLFSHLDVILKMKAAGELLIYYYASYLPFIFVQIAPFSCLLAVLYVFARLNHDNEIIAMRSTGMSIFAITRTVLLFGIMVSGFVFLVNDRIMPEALHTNQKLKVQLESGTTRTIRFKEDTLHNVTIYGLKNRLFFINSFFPKKNAMEGITILEHDEKQNIIRKIVANRGVYAGRRWKFFQSITYSFDANGQLTEEPRFEEEEIMPIPESPEEFLGQKQSPDYMALDEISDYIRKLSRSGATVVIRNLRIDFYHRLFLPFSSFLIILLAIPFGLKIRKKATGLSSLGLSLVMGFFYYVFDAVSIALGKAGYLDPLFSASLIHILALVFGIYLISKIP